MMADPTQTTTPSRPVLGNSSYNSGLSYAYGYDSIYSSASSIVGSSNGNREKLPSSTLQRPLPFTPQNSRPSSPHKRATSSSSHKIFPLTLPFHAPLRAHKPIGIYHDQYHYACLYLALSADSPPISYVTVQRLNGSPVALHLSGSPSSPIIATADYNHSSSAMELKTAAPTSAQRGIVETLDKVTFFSSSWALNMFVPSSGCRERFEWRSNSGPETALLAPKSKGLELVRIRTGEIVAAYGRTNMSARKIGKFQWFSDDWYGEEGDMMVLISLLALTEKIRRGEWELE